MTRVFRATLLTACALLILSAAIAQEYTLKLNVKEGDTFKYRSSMDIDFGGQSVLATVTITLKVLKVEENGKYSDGVGVGRDGHQVRRPRDAPACTPRDQDDPQAQRLSREGRWGRRSDATDEPRPDGLPRETIKVGDKWSETVKNAVGELKIDYEFVGVEKVGDTEAVKIKVTTRSANAKEGKATARTASTG
jgi:hypothetical protein